MNSNRPARRTSHAAVAGICLTAVPSSTVCGDDLLPRFVRATQILMIGAERRRAAEDQAKGKGAGQ